MSIIFRSKSDQLKSKYKIPFNTYSCKCLDFTHLCEHNRKVPKFEQKFLIDQRYQRKIVINIRISKQLHCRKKENNLIINVNKKIVCEIILFLR